MDESMRVAFQAKEDVPGLADKGDHVVLYLNQRQKPVVRYTQYGPEALPILAENPGSFEMISDPAPSLVMLHVLRCLLGEVTALGEETPVLQLMGD